MSVTVGRDSPRRPTNEGRRRHTARVGDFVGRLGNSISHLLSNTVGAIGNGVRYLVGSLDAAIPFGLLPVVVVLVLLAVGWVLARR